MTTKHAFLNGKLNVESDHVLSCWSVAFCVARLSIVAWLGNYTRAVGSIERRPIKLQLRLAISIRIIPPTGVGKWVSFGLVDPMIRS